MSVDDRKRAEVTVGLALFAAIAAGSLVAFIVRMLWQ